MSEDLWVFGWKQFFVQEEYGGWDYMFFFVVVFLFGLYEYLSWKRKLQLEQVDRDYKGWDQYMFLLLDDIFFGGWLYFDFLDLFDDY